MSDPQQMGIRYKNVDQDYLKQLPIIKGSVYNDIHDLKNLGFQGSVLYQCYKTIKHSIDNNYKIVLAITTNVVSCGLRQIVAKLCELRLVDCLICTAGAIEEDLIKTYCPFRYMESNVNDLKLKSQGFNRTENILCPNTGYVWFENLLKQKGSDPLFYDTTSVKLIRTLMETVQDPTSISYWCVKNHIPVVPLSIEDGAIGDHLAIKHYTGHVTNVTPSVDSTVSLPTYLNFLIKDDRKNCVIVCGGGTVKHFAMNGTIPIHGSDVTVYFNNGHWSDGSNASACIEAYSWGKCAEDGFFIKSHGDFIFTFYLVASQLIKDYTSTKS